MKQTIKALLPTGRWVGGESFSKALELLEEVSTEITKKTDSEFRIEFTQPTRANKKWSKLLNVSQIEIDQTLRQEKGASLAYFSQFLTGNMEIEEVELFKAKIKNIEVDAFKAGGSIGKREVNPIIKLFEALKPAYVSFEYYNKNKDRIV
jgi:hypothetical protein